MKVKIKNKTENIRAVWMEKNIVKMIDQRKLPFELKFFNAKNYNDVAFAVKNMVVRGAPSIGACAVYGIAQAEAQKKNIKNAAKILKKTRPTAHDLFYAIDYMLKEIKNGNDAKNSAEKYVEKLVNECRAIGVHGGKLIKNNYRILTHCNAGALATVDYGTALAPIRFAHYNKKKIFVWVDETRPRLQGMLTSWELLNENIKHRVISDNAAGYFMRKKEIDMVIVGADRIARNGDFANKIGTYEKAVLAKENSIPFYVAAPISTFDFGLRNGESIKIEERNEDEVLFIKGKRVAPEKAKAFNPAFDVTPSKYVTGYITEKGVLRSEEIKRLKK
ncbi:MAG: S-methyl-5-thioribose-1-phosphate isomerase [Thermoplasmatales archaeon]|nr:S-methyl-5-thioribose-1-phosphate isomerase [Thermoplasmatales archaeon]